MTTTITTKGEHAMTTTEPRRRARIKVGDHVRSLRTGHVYVVLDRFQNPADSWRVVFLVESTEDGDVDVFRTDEIEKVSTP